MPLDRPYYKLWSVDDTPVWTEVASDIVEISSIQRHLEENITEFSYGTLSCEIQGAPRDTFTPLTDDQRFIIEIRYGQSFVDAAAQWVFTGIVDNASSTYDEKSKKTSLTVYSIDKLIQDQSDIPARSIAVARMVNILIPVTPKTVSDNYLLEFERFTDDTLIIKKGAVVKVAAKNGITSDEEIDVKFVVGEDYTLSSPSGLFIRAKVIPPDTGLYGKKGPFEVNFISNSLGYFTIPHAEELHDFMGPIVGSRSTFFDSSIADQLYVGLGDGTYDPGSSVRSQLEWHTVKSIEFFRIAADPYFKVYFNADVSQDILLAGFIEAFFEFTDIHITTPQDVEISGPTILGVGAASIDDFTAPALIDGLVAENPILFDLFGPTVANGNIPPLAREVDIDDDRSSFLSNLQRSLEFFISISGTIDTLGGPSTLVFNLHTREFLASQAAITIDTPEEFHHSVGQIKPKTIVVRGAPSLGAARLEEDSIGWYPNNNEKYIRQFEREHQVTISAPYIIPEGAGRSYRRLNSIYRRDVRLTAYAKRYHNFYGQFWRDGSITLDGIHNDLLSKLIEEVFTGFFCIVIGESIDYVAKKTDLSVKIGNYVPSANQAPVSIIRGDVDLYCKADGFAYASLNGSLSYDPDGDPLTYQWTKNGVDIPGATGPRFFNHQVADGDIIGLRVTDPGLLTGFSDVTITVICDPITDDDTDDLGEPGPAGEDGADGRDGRDGTGSPGGGGCWEKTYAFTTITAGTTTSPWVSVEVPPLLGNLNDVSINPYRAFASPVGPIESGVEVRAEINPSATDQVRAVLELGAYTGSPTLLANVDVYIVVERYKKEDPNCWNSCWKRNQVHYPAVHASCWNKASQPDTAIFQHAYWYLGPPQMNIEVAMQPVVLYDSNGVPYVYWVEDFYGSNSLTGPNAGSDWDTKTLRVYRTVLPRYMSDLTTYDGIYEQMPTRVQLSYAGTMSDKNYHPRTVLHNGEMYLYHIDRVNTGGAEPTMGFKKYNHDLDTWTALAGFPVNPALVTQLMYGTEASQLWSDGTYIWFIGLNPLMQGTWNGIKVHRLILRYDPVADIWTYNENWISPIDSTYPFYDFPAVVVFEGRVWFLGGLWSGVSINNVRSWNHVNLAGWNNEQVLPYTTARGMAYVSNDKRIHILGGANIVAGDTMGDYTTVNWLLDHWMYDPVAGVHQQLDSPPFAPEYAGLVEWGTTYFNQIGYEGKPRKACFIIPAFFKRVPLAYAPIDYAPGVISPYSGAQAI